MADRTPSLLFATEILNLVNEIYLCQKVCTATCIDVQLVEYFLLRRLRNLASVEIDTLLRLVALQSL